MLKKRMTYTNFDGVEVTEDFYFNLTKAEIAEMQMVSGGISTYIRKIVDAKDSKQIVAVFKELILKAYGEKSEDGRRFMKSPEISANFAATEAYSDLFIELSSDADKAAEFFNAIVPQTKSDSLVPAKD